MARNKVVFNGNVLMDLSGDTLASADQLVKGVTAHDRSGNQMTGTFEGGGGANIDALTVKPSSASTTFAISGLKGEPKAFMLQYTGNITLASTRYVVSASGEGTTRRVTYGYKSGNNGYVYSSASYLTATYSNGTLTLKTSSSSNGGNFYNGNYSFIYVY